MTTRVPEPATGGPPAAAADRGPSARERLTGASMYATTAFFVAMFVFFAIANGSRFYETENISNILGQSAILGIVACGLTLPLIVNNFDLSVGWHASFAGVLGTYIATEQGTIAGILLTLLAGLAIGTASGLVVAKLRVGSLIATLGAGAILVGLALRVSDGIQAAVPTAYATIGQEALGSVPLAALLMLLIAGVLWVVVEHTPFGRAMYAIGGSREAARLAGLNIGRMTVITLALSGFFAALGGVILSSTVGTAQPGAGDNLLLDGFTAAAIGMVTFRRGQYNIAGTVVAVLLLSTMLNGMTMIGWEPFWQNIVKGVILIAAVAASIGGSEDR